MENTGSGAVDDGVRRYNGDGLVMRMRSNHRTLEITGDGCRIVLSKNSGSIHVVGDGCRLSVGYNVGDIEYTGDGGRVLLGPDSSTERVKYVGDGGKVILDSSLGDPTIENGRYCTTDPRKSPRESRKIGDSSTGRDNEKSDCVPKIACSCEEVIERTLLRHEIYEGRDVDGNAWVPSNSECLDNALNDAKERKQGKYAKRDEDTEKHSPHRIVTAKTITKIQVDGRCVRKRFGDSTMLILNSIHSGNPATSASGTSNVIE